MIASARKPRRIAPCLRMLATLALLVASSPCLAQAVEAPLSQPRALHIAKGMASEETQRSLLPALRYFAFWNTGDERYAREALGADFVDLNLPKGREQGPNGPIQASKDFRQAVPDLKASAEEVWVNGDRVIGRLRFTGLFTGQFGALKGKGQPIAFDAVDIYTVKDGRIVANWHLEDSLTLLQQLGVVPTP